jgi:hypothetical protein
MDSAFFSQELAAVILLLQLPFLPCFLNYFVGLSVRESQFITAERTRKELQSQQE